MAVFYPFLFDNRGDVPEQAPLVYRVASFIGAVAGDQPVAGPLLDTGEIDDVHELLMLVGLNHEDMQEIRLNDGHARRFGWVAFDTVLSITPEIVFALDEAAAREFLLDLRRAVEMLKLMLQNDHGGCMIEVAFPQSA